MARTETTDLTTAEVAVVASLEPIGTANQQIRVNAGATSLEYFTPSTSGDVVGPVSATDNAIARFDAITGKLIQDSGATVDDNGNIYVNNYFAGLTSTVSAGGTTILTIASDRTQTLTGSSTQTFQLPNATTLPLASVYEFNNNSSSSLIVTNNGGTIQYTVPAGGVVNVALTNNGTANGAWDFSAQAPASVTWSSGIAGLVMNTALSTTPSIATGASSATVPSFVPQRGSLTTGFGGDGTNLYATIAGTARATISATGITATNLSGTNTGNQTIANTSDATSHTATLSATGGSIKLVEGANITLTTTGTSADGIVTIASTGGAGLTNFTEGVNTSAPNATVPVVSLTATNAATNVDIALVPKGTGAFTLAVADNLVSGGNKRGANAIDLQTLRSANTQVASGMYAVAIGANNTSSNNLTLAVGYNNNVSGNQSVGVGKDITSSGISSNVFGNNSTASGNSSVAIGVTCTANNTSTLAIGGSTNASGTSSSAVGFGNTASGNNSSALGYNSTAQSFGETTLGLWSTTGAGTAGSYVATDRLLVVGNGTSSGARSDAITVLKNGNTTIAGTLTPQQSTTALAPAYVKGAMYFDTTLNKLRVGGATAWETVTSV